MDSKPKHINQNSADVEDSEQILGSKIQNEQLKNELKCLKESVEENRSMLNDMKSLKESHDHLLKKFQDLEKFVISQNQNKTQNEQGKQSNSNSEKLGNDEEPNFENPFCFEQPPKKIKLEDQSEEIQRLNQIINDLKEDNSKLSKMNAKLVTENDHFKKKQNEGNGDGNPHEMDRIGSDLEGDASEGGNKTNGNPDHVSAIQRCMQSLVHACQCRDANCRLPSCHLMKRLATHTRNCQRKINGGCPICKQVIALCCYHAKVCSDAKCPAQFCQNIKQKLRYQQLQQQQQSQQQMPNASMI